METEEAPKSTVVPDEATIAKTTVEVLTKEAEIVAAYGAGTLTVRVLVTAVAGRLNVTDAARAKAILLPTVKATLMDYMAAHYPPPAEEVAIAKTTIEMLTSDDEVIAAYGTGKLSVHAFMTAVANRLGVTDEARTNLFFKPNVEVIFIDWMDKHDPTLCLNNACSSGNLNVIRRLLDGGCDIDELDIDGQTPLYHACDNGQIEAARLLLHRGADVDLSGKDHPPLLAACVAGRYGVACLLIFVGRANVNRANDQGSTPLLAASIKGHWAMAKILIDRGADVNRRRDQDGITALLMACNEGHTEIVRLLIDRGGADINLAAPDGRTPFFVACQTGLYDIVELLMHKGAITDKTYDGMLPLEIAITRGHDAIAELVRPGIMEALRALEAAKGKSSTISAEHRVALAPIRANAHFRRAQEAARRAR